MRGWCLNFKSSDNQLKCDFRKECILALDCDVVGVTETHHGDNDKIDVPGYQWFGLNRKLSHKNAPHVFGGVGILVKDALLESYKFQIVDQSTEGILWARLTNIVNGQVFSVCVCYLAPPNSTYT